MIPFVVMALIYIVLVLLITLLVKLVERAFGKSDKKNEN
jgi:polar amino acid transport system permease protein